MQSAEFTIRTRSSLLLLFFLFQTFSSGCQSQSNLVPGQHTMELSESRIWYHVLGDGNTPPLLMLHGGPGGTSYSMYALDPLAEDFTLIIFDQPGTGRSGNLSDTTLMTMDFFVEQLHEFIRGLGLEAFYLYGHSWGTMLGLDYYLKYPNGIKAMIMNSPVASARMWMQDADTLIATLHDTIRHAIRISEETGNFDTDAYRNAMVVYYRNFIGRGKRIKNQHGLEYVPGNSLMYNYMWGPSEFTATGTLRDYDRLDRLDEIEVPVLWITGEYDEARPSTVEYYHTLTPGSEFEVIEGAAHATMHDQRDENVRMIREFLLQHVSR